MAREKNKKFTKLWNRKAHYWVHCGSKKIFKKTFKTFNENTAHPNIYTSQPHFPLPLFLQALHSNPSPKLHSFSVSCSERAASKSWQPNRAKQDAIWQGKSPCSDAGQRNPIRGKDSQEQAKKIKKWDTPDPILKSPTKAPS